MQAIESTDLVSRWRELLWVDQDTPAYLPLLQNSQESCRFVRQNRLWSLY